MKQRNELVMCEDTTSTCNSNSNSNSTSRKRIKLAPLPSMLPPMLFPTGSLTHMRTPTSQATTLPTIANRAVHSPPPPHHHHHHPSTDELRGAFPLDDARIVATCLQPRLPVRVWSPALPPPPEPRLPRRHVRFAPYDTVVRIPSTGHCKSTCWYERKDYEAFALDCRQSILAFLCRRQQQQQHQEEHEMMMMMTTSTTSMSSTACSVISQHSSSPPASQRNHHDNHVYYFTIHGLDDFTSFEAKLLRTQRRFDHITNVLYHQSLLQQLRCLSNTNTTSTTTTCNTINIITNDDDNGALCSRVTAQVPPQQYQDDHDRRRRPDQCRHAAAETMILQQIAQLSSLESSRLALSRGRGHSVVRWW